MQAKIGILGIAICAVLSLPACGRIFGADEKQPKLLNARSASRSPDEFLVLPTKPLQLPDDLKELPEPTPGSTNITDPTPEADAVAALGGRPEALSRSGISAGNGGLVSHASRFGVASDVRSQLAAEDLDYRRKNDGRLLERMFNVNVYYKAYRPMSLDKYATLEFWRSRGVRTVGAPPVETLEEN